jgi:hypothetical protein
MAAVGIKASKGDLVFDIIICIMLIIILGITIYCLR